RDGHLAVDSPYLISNRGREAPRIGVRSHHQRKIPLRILKKWAVHLRPGLRVDRGVLYIVNHAYYQLKVVRVVRRTQKLYPLSQRVFAGKVLASQGLVNDRDTRRVFLVVLGELSAFHQRYPQRTEIIDCYKVVIGQR